MAQLDWIVLASFLGFIIILGLSFSKKAGKDLSSFFLGGRNLPWYLAGVSMVATTFAADTPLAVTELVAGKGISGNWLWWNALIGGMLTTFFFARLWRRSGVLTEVELIELRYSGTAAKALRGFKAIYLGAFMNVLIIGWVNLAMISILQVFFELSFQQGLLYTGAAMSLVALYAASSGFLGVAITDFVQFFVAMAGSIVLAYMVIQTPEIGGLEGLSTQVRSISPGALDFLPRLTDADITTGGKVFTISILTFIAYAGIQWWASWYPGAEPGGGGYVAQRMLSAKNEKHAIYATLFFQVAHYCIRPWPWILVALSAMVLYNLDTKIDPVSQGMLTEVRGYPGFSEKLIFDMDALKANEELSPNQKSKVLQLRQTIQSVALANGNTEAISKAEVFARDARKGYVMAMKEFLPVGWKGLLLAAFFAAYMSTISTQLNWGASYLINDLYKRFLRKPDSFQNVKEEDRHYVFVSRLTTIALMILGLAITTQMDSISGVWSFILECGAGLGLVLILRWFWWRINAWSEIAAAVAPFVGYTLGKYVLFWSFPDSFLFTVAFTTVSWIVVTLITKPTDTKQLRIFYDKIQPGGNWSVFPDRRQHVSTSHTIWLLVAWLDSTVLVYSILFFVGKWLLFGLDAALPILLLIIFTFVIFMIAVKRTRIFDEDIRTNTNG